MDINIVNIPIRFKVNLLLLKLLSFQTKLEVRENSDMLLSAIATYNHFKIWIIELKPAVICWF